MPPGYTSSLAFGTSFAERYALSAIGTGHLRNVTAPGEGILARQREVRPLVELRVPFELDRQQIDDVERGSSDSDWQPAKDAAKLLAFAEDRAIFDGYAAAGIGGIREGTSNPVLTLPSDVLAYPAAIAVCGVLGFLFPDRPWRWALILMFMQLPVMSLNGAGDSLLPLGLILVAVLSLPGIGLGQLGAMLRRKTLRET